MGIAKKHVWHGLLVMAIGLFMLGTLVTLVPEVVVEGAQPWIIFALVLIGIGGLAAIAGKDFFSKRSILLEYYEAIVFALAIAFVVRTFIIEPFKIPSGSMIPTLLVGDYLFVNKFTFGYRVPYTRSRIFMGEGPKRGDVIVFKYPVEPDKNYIKRVVGLPGDRVVYQDKRIILNGNPLELEANGTYAFNNEVLAANRFIEQLGERRHDILLQKYSNSEPITDIVVPAHHYFVLGDNRDNSRDSRYWGFVPDYWLVGRAMFLFWSLDDDKSWPFEQLRTERLGQAVR